MPDLGDPVRILMTKWGDRPHWEFAGVFLGRDDHGAWVGFPAGTHHRRPGVEMVSEVASVTLVPDDAGSLATLHAPGAWVDTYVDVTTVPRWDGAVVRAVDLDLDVVRTAEGRTYVDDEDEFADHRVRLGYPPEVVGLALRSCAEVLEAVQQGRAPYDGTTAARWLGVLRDLTPGPG